jgi:hypothetical protein
MKKSLLAWPLAWCCVVSLSWAQDVPESNPESAPVVEDVPVNPGDRQGLAREEMWRAPTEAEWNQPVLIAFERTFEDALAVSQATGKPIMACINMDGEIASEHYAGVRYRQPEVAALFEPYVCVIASVYRHTPRDYDANGERVLCPRFGSVTCGEHITMEPILYDKYLDEARVSPRHVVIELDGSESLDVYYANDTAAVFDVIIESAQGRPEPKPEAYWDMPITSRTGFASSANRAALEQAFRTGTVEVRRTLLQKSIETAKSGGPEQHELWRLALQSKNAELARLAVQGIATSDRAESIDLVLATLQDLEFKEDREVMVQTLERIGTNSERARTLVASFRGLDQDSKVVDQAATQKVLNVAPEALHEEAVDKLSTMEKARGGATYGATEPMGAAEAALQRATAGMDLTRSANADPRFVPLYLEDVARDLDLARPLLETEAAWSWNLTDIAYDLYVSAGPVGLQAAEGRALALVPTLPPAALQQGGAVVRDVLAAFMRARQRAITTAVSAKKEWPADWMADVKDTWTAIQGAPNTSAWDCIQHQDFLRYMGAFAEANAVLEAAVTRYPLDPYVHDRLRNVLIWTKDLAAMDGLEARYDQLVSAYPDEPTMRWYAGYASRMAAEIRRRQQKGAQATATYDRAIALFDASAEGAASSSVSANFEIGLCLAGQARLALEAGNLELAVAKLQSSFEIGPDAAGTVDGLNLTAIMTATTLLNRLEDTAPLKAMLRVELDALRAYNPRLFDLPEFERNSAGQPAVGFGGRRFGGPR